MCTKVCAIIYCNLSCGLGALLIDRVTCHEFAIAFLSSRFILNRYWCCQSCVLPILRTWGDVYLKNFSCNISFIVRMDYSEPVVSPFNDFANGFFCVISSSLFLVDLYQIFQNFRIFQHSLAFWALTAGCTNVPTTHRSEDFTLECW